MKRILTSETPDQKDKEVLVAGWVQTRRDHGKIIFLDLRDRGGLLQIVVTSDEPDAYKIAQQLRPEWVVEIQGTIQERPDKLKNPDLITGDIEMTAEAITVLTEAATLPLPIDTEGYEISEETRLKYRYLDLRRPRLHRNLQIRHKVIQFIRGYLIQQGFIEIETPLLTKSTPEGARDFLVPSRLSPGKFYALPQSPQQYKQLLQVAGFERYFQIARALRDEDPRGDRQAEHTQLDIEMSFVERDDVLNLIESLYIKLIEELFLEKKIQKIPFPRFTYKEVMEKYHSDKPDLRKDKNDPTELAFGFVVDFPAFEWKEQDPSTGSGQGRWDAMHNPFSRPKTDNPQEIKNNPGEILSFQYDLFLNGHEIAGGSLRAYRPEILEATFEAMGHTKEQIKKQFGHMLEAFTYGVPPHGGIASGIDRFCAILLGEPNIREVIAFPKTGDNRDLMMDSPSEVSEEQLKELHLHIEKKDDKKP